MEGQTTSAYKHDQIIYFQDIDSSTSTPFVSAPSSPGRAAGSPLHLLAPAPAPASAAFFYSAPASPMHFLLSPASSSSMHSQPSLSSSSSSYEFEFSARFGISGGAPSGGSMTSADELFLNGQIRPMKLSSHLQRPQALDPLLDLDESQPHPHPHGGGGVHEEEEEDAQLVLGRGRDLKWRDRSLRRRTRSMSPLRTPAFLWHDYEEEEEEEEEKTEITEAAGVGSKEEVSGEANHHPSMSASSSRSSSSASRSSKRWVFLKDFLYRSKSEGRNNGHKFWSSISFSPVHKDRKIAVAASSESTTTTTDSDKKESCSISTCSSESDGKKKEKKVKQQQQPGIRRKATNGVAGGKRRIQLSPHEVHYKASRAQAEELRKKTFLPYRQGLLGCLGFSSKGYGAINGFARALNPVSSR